MGRGTHRERGHPGGERQQQERRHDTAQAPSYEAGAAPVFFSNVQPIAPSLPFPFCFSFFLHLLSVTGASGRAGHTHAHTGQSALRRSDEARSLFDVSLEFAYAGFEEALLVLGQGLLPAERVDLLDAVRAELDGEREELQRLAVADERRERLGCVGRGREVDVGVLDDPRLAAVLCLDEGFDESVSEVRYDPQRRAGRWKTVRGESHSRMVIMAEEKGGGPSVRGAIRGRYEIGIVVSRKEWTSSAL